MLLLQRYIAKSIIQTTLMVMLVLLSINIFFLFVNEIRLLGTGHYQWVELIAYIILQIPSHLYTLFPLSALIGTIMGLGLLNSHAELTIMRAQGISVFKIAGFAIRAAFLMILVMFFVGEVLAPYATSLSETEKTSALSFGKAMQTPTGVWLKEGKEFVHISRVLDEAHIEGLTRYHFNAKRELERTSFAEKGYYDGHIWQLSDIHVTQFLKDKVNSQYIQHMAWSSNFTPTILSTVRTKDISELGFWSLIKNIRYRIQNKLETTQYQVALLKKLFQPITVLVMVLLGVPFVFGPLRQAQLGLKLLGGILLGFSFYVINATFNQLPLVVNISPLITAMIPSLLVGSLATFMLKRYR